MIRLLAKLHNFIRKWSGSRTLCLGSVAVLCFVRGENAFAGKFDLNIGGFSIQSAGKMIANLGNYSLAYRHTLFWGLEAGIGYTFIMSTGFGGDLAYGLEFQLNWFPFTETERRTWTEGSHFVSQLEESWRPYFGFIGAQRTFQSIATTYSGFGAQLGIERHIVGDLSVTGKAKYLYLLGPSSAVVNEADILLGVSLTF